MRNTQAARYARWSAMISLLLTLLVAGVYLKRSWEAHLSHLAAPPPVPSSVQQQSAAFSFSKEAGNRTQFTVRASRATQFTEGGLGVLDDVWITAYGNDGHRFDNLRTHSCDYIDSTGNITCAGEVRIDLESAEDARLHPSAASQPNPDARVIHIVTSHVSFDRDTGVATTDDRVQFQFSGMAGQAVGFHYDSGAGEMRLLRDVDIDFHGGDAETAPGGRGRAGSDAPPLHVSGSGLVFNRNDRIVHLLGPAKADQGEYELAAGQLNVELNEQFRARSLMANGDPELHSTGLRPVSVAADEFSVPVSPDGSVQRIIATGNVHGRQRSASGDERLDASKADLELSEKSREPKLLTATGSVAVQSDRGGIKRRLTTSELEMSFVAGSKTGGRDANGEAVRIGRVTAPAASVDVEEPVEEPAQQAAKESAQARGPAKTERIHLTSQHLEAIFGGANEVQEFRGTGGVEVDRRGAIGPAESSTSQEVVVRFGTDGAWSDVDEAGDVHLREGESSAQSDRAHFDRLLDTVTLTGSAAVSLMPPSPGSSPASSAGPADAGSRTTAQSVTFRRAANEVVAEGRVATSELAGAKGTATRGGSSFGSGFGLGLGDELEHISADRLVADTGAGHAVYSGHARLWQGSSLIEADTIEVDRPMQTIVAVNHVRAAFPQATWTGASAQAGRTEHAGEAARNSAGQASIQGPTPKLASKSAGQTEFWRVEAGKMTYANNDGRARLEQGVRARSNEGSIRADAMDLFFAPEDPGSVSGRGAEGQGTAKQLVRATALGHVAIDQDNRHGTGDRGEYVAAEAKFVLSGGPPSVRDDLGNSTSGRQLTLFFADDKILIDSASGLRTVTTHRVEK
jgi:lipopolysaccharide export system protein LptA